ncbi:protein PET117 homolog, mitochondrial [Drosophila tropicalis]|uniref:protein PET117 homolog, mitochondrial n=1 Tax=Drosophila tropicalis TaxID=46794 RepID=UPI0035AB9019
MSVPSKIALSVAVAVSSAIIGYVHYKQSADRLKLHEGVIRDVEQQQRRKHENTYTLQQQIDITKQLKAREVSSAGAGPKTTTTTAQQTVGTEEQTASRTNLRPVMESTGIQVQVPEEQSTDQVPPAAAEWEANRSQAQGEAPPKRQNSV